MWKALSNNDGELYVQLEGHDILVDVFKDGTVIVDQLHIKDFDVLISALPALAVMAKATFGIGWGEDG